jgi:hypothetical protein
MRHDVPVKVVELTPMVIRAEVTMVDTRADEGVGRGATTQDPFGPRTSLGKRGGQTVHRLPGRRLQSVLGRVLARSMKRPSCN